jgi:hypothetical protein
VDRNGGVVTFNPTAPTSQTPVTIDPGQKLMDVDCPSTSRCVAVDDAGRELMFDPAAPGAPAPAPIHNIRLFGVSCPSLTQCTAVDQAEDNGPGYELTFDPAAPATPAAVQIFPSVGSMTIDCPSVKRCVAASTGVATTFDPTKPGTPLPVPVDPIHRSGTGHIIWDISCPSTSLCAIADSEGSVVTWDPALEPPSVTTTKESSITVLDYTDVTVAGSYKKAKPRTRVVGELIFRGKTIKHKNLRLSSKRKVSWGLGRLTTGPYRAKLSIGGKVVRNVSIAVAGIGYDPT